jgi:hypothetical protein
MFLDWRLNEISYLIQVHHFSDESHIGVRVDGKRSLRLSEKRQSRFKCQTDNGQRWFERKR